MNKLDNIKAIVLDLDGTLLTPELKILDNTRNILLHAKNKGIKIIIASGRTPQTAVRMTQELDVSSPMVLANGALIYNPTDKSILDYNPISTDTIKYLLSLSKEINISLNIYTPYCIYMDEHKINDYIKDSGDDKKNLIKTHAIGPTGWNEALKEILCK